MMKHCSINENRKKTFIHSMMTVLFCVTNFFLCLHTFQTRIFTRFMIHYNNNNNKNTTSKKKIKSKEIPFGKH